MWCGLWLGETGADPGPSAPKRCLGLCQHHLAPVPTPPWCLTPGPPPRAWSVWLVSCFSILIKESDQELTQ